MNMSYCRFHNTLLDLRDCFEHIDDDVNGEGISQEEMKYRWQLIELCRDIAYMFENKEESDPTLEEMLSTITDDNRQELVNWGKDVGREVVED